MATIDIRDITGAIIASPSVTQNCERVEELMQSDHAELSWRSDAGTPLPIGAYIIWNGEKLTLIDEYTPEQRDELEWEYRPQFKSRIMNWAKTPYFHYTYGENNAITAREPDWTLTDNAYNFMSSVAHAIKNETGETWTIEVDAGLTGTLTIHFSSTDIFSALSEIAGQFKTEWWTDKQNNVLHLGKAAFGEPVKLTVGENIKTPSVTNNTEGYYNRFFAFGSTRNITQDYHGANTNNLVNKRLTLDPVKYPQGYVDVRKSPQEPVFSKILIFDEIYPKSNLKVANVRGRLMYRVNETGAKIQVGTDNEGNPIYDQYTIWYFQLPGFSFNNTTYSKDNPNGMLIAGKELSGHFKSGRLIDREFALIYHDKDENVTSSDGQPFQVLAGDYEIKFIEENGYILPNSLTIAPEDGDDVILVNIRMPQEYVDASQTELADELEKAIAKYSLDLNNYSFDSNPIAFDASNPQLAVGHNVVYSNQGKELSTRIIKLVTKMDYPIEQNITIGNEQIKKSTQLEKARLFDPLGHTGLTLLGKIILPLSGKIKIPPVGYRQGNFFS